MNKKIMRAIDFLKRFGKNFQKEVKDVYYEEAKNSNSNDLSVLKFAIGTVLLDYLDFHGEDGSEFAYYTAEDIIEGDYKNLDEIQLEIDDIYNQQY